MRRNSILIVSSYLPPEQSGSGFHAYRFTKYLINSGYSAHLLSFNRNLKFKKVQNITRIPYLNKGVFCKLISLPLIITYYLYFIIKNKIVFIYGNKIIAYQIIILFAYILGRKVVFRSLLLGIDDINSILGDGQRLKKKIYKSLLNLVSVYFSINNLFTEIFISNSLSGPVLLKSPQGVDVSHFCPASLEGKQHLREKLKIPNEQFIILVPGLLIKRKGYESTFESLANLDLDFLLLVVGQNSPENSFLPKKEKNEMTYLKKIGNSLLQNKIMFTGVTDNINEYMQIADVMIINSENEGMPNVLLEAFASGLPVICRKLEGVSDFFLQHNINSLIFKDTQELNKHLSFMFNNPAERVRIGKNAREFALNHLSFDKVTKDLFQKLN